MAIVKEAKLTEWADKLKAMPDYYCIIESPLTDALRELEQEIRWEAERFDRARAER